MRDYSTSLQKLLIDKVEVYDRLAGQTASDGTTNNNVVSTTPLGAWPCAFVLKKLDQPTTKHEAENKVSLIGLLVCKLGVPIQKGNEIKVTASNGNIFRGIAGKPNKYPYHQELNIESFERE